MTDGTERPDPPRRSIAAGGLRNFSFKLPPPLVAQLDRIAVSEGRSRNAHVRLMLTESVDAHLTEQKKLRKARKLRKHGARA